MAEIKHVYIGLDLASKPDQTAMRCLCGLVCCFESPAPTTIKCNKCRRKYKLDADGNYRALMRRRPIRKAELIEIVCRMKISSVDASNTVPQIKDAIAWLGHCECGGEHDSINKSGMFLGKVEYDHRIPNAQLYEGDEIDWRALLPACHELKTKGDNRRTAKARRQAGETGQQARRRRNGPSLKSGRGFGPGAPLKSGKGFQDRPDGHKNQWGKRPLKSRNTFKKD